LAVNEGADSPERKAVEVSGLTHAQRKRVVLSCADLSVPAGAIFGIAGMASAGKTALLKHVVGLLRAQKGAVRVLGVDVIDAPRECIGYAPQDNLWPPNVPLREILRLLRSIYPTWDAHHARRLLEAFAIDASLNSCKLNASESMCFRIVGAVAHRPALAVLDEPFGAQLSDSAGAAIADVLKHVRREGTTILLASRSRERIDRVCDLAALLKDGEIVWSGDAHA
jgi:ABC-2 type transport system ATP-binding protein